MSEQKRVPEVGDVYEWVEKKDGCYGYVLIVRVERLKSEAFRVHTLGLNSMLGYRLVICLDRLNAAYRYRPDLRIAAIALDMDPGAL